MADSLSLSVQMIGDITVVEASGELDVYTHPRLTDTVKDVIVHGRTSLVLDIDELNFLDSSGLGPIVGLSKRAKAYGGFLLLVCNQEKLMKIFRITGLYKSLPIYNSVEEALSAAEKILHPDAERRHDGPDEN
ncbi:STAS domain-containing protein [Streptomyces iakyrus]|uniref:STAS domain-containing protein n=1 Tax=Streptomyces iakyrus TaxID=68219 RepID=UPI0036C31346